MKRIITSVMLSIMLLFSTFSAGCSVSQFEQALNEVGPAVATILQIVALIKGSPADLSLAAKIDADTANLEKLYSDFQSAEAANKGNVAAQINASFAVLQADLGTVFAVAQVSDKDTQFKISALLGLITSAVHIAEAAVIHPAAMAAGPKALRLDADSLRDSFNTILVAKTGNAQVDSFTAKHKLHKYGKFVRAVSFGLAK